MKEGLLWLRIRWGLALLVWEPTGVCQSLGLRRQLGPGS